MAAIFIVAFLSFGRIKLNLRGKNFRPLFPIALSCPCLYFIAETLGISRTTFSESGIFLACIPEAALRHPPLYSIRNRRKTKL